MKIVHWVLFLTLFLSTADLFSQDNPQLVKIAVCGPFTGGGADYGKMIQRGANLKLKELNAKAQETGYEYELVFQDDEGNASVATTVAQKVASNQNIACVIGHFNSACSLAAKPIYRRQGIVSLSPGSTNVQVCEGSDWFFRNLYRDDFQGKNIARYIHEVLKLKRVAVIFDNDAYGAGLKDFFVKAALEYGLSIVGMESYNRDATKDFNSIVTKLKYKKPEIVFVSGLYSEAGLIAAAMEAKGIKAALIGGDGVFNPKYIEIGKGATDGAYITTPFVDDPSIGPKVSAFSESFRKQYQTEPDAWAALSYDAMGTLAQTIQTVGPDRKKIRDHLAQMTEPQKGYDGVTGVTFFDANGDCVKPLFVSQVRQGKLAMAPQQLGPDVAAKQAAQKVSPASAEDLSNQNAQDSNTEAEKQKFNKIYILVGLALVFLIFWGLRKPAKN